MGAGFTFVLTHVRPLGLQKRLRFGPTNCVGFVFVAVALSVSLQVFILQCAPTYVYIHLYMSNWIHVYIYIYIYMVPLLLLVRCSLRFSLENHALLHFKTDLLWPMTSYCG